MLNIPGFQSLSLPGAGVGSADAAVPPITDLRLVVSAVSKHEETQDLRPKFVFRRVPSRYKMKPIKFAMAGRLKLDVAKKMRSHVTTKRGRK
jgi:hypothetical protein